MRSGRLVARGAAKNDDWRAGNRHWRRRACPSQVEGAGPARRRARSAPAGISSTKRLRGVASGRRRTRGGAARASVRAASSRASCRRSRGGAPPRCRRRRRARAGRGPPPCRHEHDRELEALGGVQGHQRDAVGAAVPRVDVGDQRHLLEIVLQRAARRRRTPPCPCRSSSRFCSRSRASALPSSRSIGP